MTTSSCAPAPRSLFQLATHQKHQFPLNEGKRVDADPQTKRGPRVERECPICHAVKITAFLANGGVERLYRRAGETAESAEDPGCGPREGGHK